MCAITERTPWISSVSSADLCHAVLLKRPFTAEGWLWELKHDGFRAFVRHSETVELLSRNGRSMSNAFPEIVAAIAALPSGVFDGELVVPDNKGRSDFGALRRRSIMKRQATIDQAARESPAALILSTCWRQESATCVRYLCAHVRIG